VDEFQNFITPSMAEILSGARKYRLSLVLAHQELAQLGKSDAVSSAVLANAGTRIVFRVGDSDARELARGFAHFEAEAIQSLGIGEAIVRVERSDQDFNLRVPFDSNEGSGDEARREEAVRRSRSRYATSRDEIEACERQRLIELAATQPAKRQEPKKPELAATEPPEPVPPPVVPERQPSQSTPPIAPEAPQYASTSLKADLEELGRGGEIHKAAQADFKRLAEQRGFRATIERQLPGSLDTVDLYLERDGVGIACEVSVTNTLEYEMRNVTKCLRAGVQHVLVLAVDAEKHQRLSAAITSLLSPEQQKLVLCLMKDEFAAFLDAIPQKEPNSKSAPIQESQGKPKLIKGWKVRTNSVPPPSEDLPAVEKELAAAMAESLRRRKTKKREKK
jgi:hypothetical protein